ncbi:hypothetical protein COK67_20070 [Bacillus cereus]|uniref:hypothetical protein n=1 Tax=Bacillus cereus TaxID=1396 RepID=UPI000BF8E71C|nr:hypothetical protein [Bacillus cereus]PFT62609.1 hypothetical protein COK67_20070 [Bacillus cereus]
MGLREDKFIELSQNRMTRILTTMTTVANLSNSRYYEFYQSEISELFYSYEEAGKECKQVFTRNTDGAYLKTHFKFSTPPAEPKTEKNIKFREVAERRMSKVFYDLKLIANLSDRSHYAYNESQIDELFQAFEEKGINTKIWFMPAINEFRYSNTK